VYFSDYRIAANAAEFPGDLACRLSFFPQRLQPFDAFICPRHSNPPKTFKPRHSNSPNAQNRSQISLSISALLFCKIAADDLK
jgi:hypothetical protein